LALEAAHWHTRRGS